MSDAFRMWAGKYKRWLTAWCKISRRDGMVQAGVTFRFTDVAAIPGSA